MIFEFHDSLLRLGTLNNNFYYGDDAKLIEEKDQEIEALREKLEELKKS